MRINALIDNTEDRARNLTRRKADIQKLNLNRDRDPYVLSASPEKGVIQQYGRRHGGGTDVALSRLRQDVFRRPNDLGSDQTVIGGFTSIAESYWARHQEARAAAVFPGAAGCVCRQMVDGGAWPVTDVHLCGCVRAQLPALASRGAKKERAWRATTFRANARTSWPR